MTLLSLISYLSVLTFGVYFRLQVLEHKLTLHSTCG